MKLKCISCFESTQNYAQKILTTYLSCDYFLIFEVGTSESEFLKTNM